MKHWYFAFFKNGRYRLPGWMEFCLRNNYGHVLAFAQLETAVTVLNPRACWLEVDNRFHPQGPTELMPVEFIALDFCLHGADVVRISYPADLTMTSHCITNFFPGCVTLAKNLLGISAWVFTPYQFMQWLLENGGEFLTDEKQDAIVQNLVGRPLTKDEKQNVFKAMRRR